MGSFSEDSSEKNKLIIGIWAGVSSNDALSSPAALDACYAGYEFPSTSIPWGWDL
jgi:hypothetical protein